MVMQSSPGVAGQKPVARAAPGQLMQVFEYQALYISSCDDILHSACFRNGNLEEIPRSQSRRVCYYITDSRAAEETGENTR